MLHKDIFVQSMWSHFCPKYVVPFSPDYYYYYYYKVNAGWGRDKKTKKKKTKKHKNVACCIRTFLSKVCGPIFPGLLLLLLLQSERWLGEEARKQRRKKQKV